MASLLLEVSRYSSLESYKKLEKHKKAEFQRKGWKSENTRELLH